MAGQKVGSRIGVGSIEGSERRLCVKLAGERRMCLSERDREVNFTLALCGAPNLPDYAGLSVKQTLGSFV